MNDLGVHPFQETSIIHILICSSLRPTFCDFTTFDCHEGRRRPLPFWQHCSSSSQCNHDMNTAFALSLSLYIYMYMYDLVWRRWIIYKSIYIQTRRHTHTHMLAYIYIYIYVCKCIATYIYIYVYTHMIRYKYIFERMYTYTSIYTHCIHTCIIPDWSSNISIIYALSSHIYI